MKHLRYLLFVFLIGLAFVSCTGKKGYLKYKAKHVEIFAQDCANSFPVKTVFIKGKDSITIKDSLIKGDSIACPQSKEDKEKGVKPTFAKCPDSKVITKVVLRVDTLVQRDSSILFLNEKLKKTVQLQDDKIKELRSAKISLILGCIILTIGLILLVLAWFKK